LSDVNPVIKKYAEQLLPKYDDDDKEKSSCSNTRIFVPLCGKTVDMAYLVPLSAEVVGVEGIRIALDEFAQDHPDLKVVLVEQESPSNGGAADQDDDNDNDNDDGFERWKGDKITLLKGDYFELDDTKTNGKFGAIYDRASMVAIEPDLRISYVNVLGNLMAPGGKILLIALDRRGTEEAMKLGPPFSLPEATIRELFEGLEWVDSVTILEQTDQLETKPEDKERYPDLDQLLEVVYLIQAK
jgi:thiopurine S-methyltransferase